MYKYLATVSIGGLYNVGYTDNSDNLIVLSSQGRGVIDCLTGGKIYRDSVDWWAGFEETSDTIMGFGPEAGKNIKIYGVNNPINFNIKTANGWELTVANPASDDPPFERFNVTKVYLNNYSLAEHDFITKDGACELRALGFSQTGRSFVIALSCEIVIWTKV